MLSTSEIIIICSVSILTCLVLITIFLLLKIGKRNQELYIQEQISRENAIQEESNKNAEINRLNEKVHELASLLHKAGESLTEIKTKDASTAEQINLIGQNLMKKHDDSNEIISKNLSELNKAFNMVESLGSNVQGLNEILQNKQARGAFSEVILENLIKTTMAQSQYSFQQQLSNNSRVDCALSLDHEGGKLMCIDSKFPLDAYNNYVNKNSSLADIKRDVKKHIKDISSKYIIHGETTEWALMFVPSEIIFSFIHSEMQDLVSFSFEHKVAIVSPNSMMATIVTVNAAIRDYTFNKETLKIRNLFLDVIKEFERWNDRFEKLKSTYKRFGDELENSHISSNKINSKLEKIKNTDLEQKTKNPN